MTPRAVALAVGLAYAAITVVELMAGELSLGDVTVIDRTTKSNLLHWAIGLAMLGSYFGGRSPTTMACRAVGGLFLVLTVWGLLSAVSLGSVLGYQDGIPASYQGLHALTAAACLAGGLLRRPQTA